MVVLNWILPQLCFITEPLSAFCETTFLEKLQQSQRGIGKEKFHVQDILLLQFYRLVYRHENRESSFRFAFGKEFTSIDNQTI